MNRLAEFPSIAVCLFAASFSSCSNPESGEHDGSELGRESRSEHEGGGREAGREGRGEHKRESGEAHGGEGEESGTEFTLDQTFDQVRNGARLVLAYDATSNSFRGTVKNTTAKTLKRVRVEVHLSNGKELGPTKPVNLGPGDEHVVELTATSKGFERWSAHPEIGSGEHGHGGEGGGEHDRKGSATVPARRKSGEHKGK
jgi:hypothetical protein